MKKLILSMIIFTSPVIANEADTFSQINSYCYQEMAFPLMGSCVNKGLDNAVPDWKANKHATYVMAYIEWLNAAGNRVLNNEMEEKDGRKGSVELLNRLRSQAKQNERQQNTGAGLGAFFAGMAIMMGAQQGAYQQPIQSAPPPQMQTYSFPNSKPITCTQMGQFVNCF